MRTHIMSVIFVQKLHSLETNHKETSDKPKSRDILKPNRPAIFKIFTRS